MVIGSLIALVWAFSYFAFFWSTTGQTPGDRLLGIRVIDQRSLAPLKPRRAMARVFYLVLAAIPFCLGFLWILVDAAPPRLARQAGRQRRRRRDRRAAADPLRRAPSPAALSRAYQR